MNVPVVGAEVGRMLRAIETKMSGDTGESANGGSTMSVDVALEETRV